MRMVCLPRRVALLACSILATAVALAQPARPAPAGKDVVVSPDAAAVHAEALLIDGHNDLPWELRETDGPSFRNIDLRRPQKQFHTDIDRLRKGNVGAQFWSAYVPTSFGKKGTAVRATLEQVENDLQEHPEETLGSDTSPFADVNARAKAYGFVDCSEG